MKTAMQELIDFNDKLISEYGDILTAYEILQRVIQRAAILLEEEKQQIMDARDNGIRGCIHGYTINNEEYYNETYEK